ncbi:MAG: glycosyltransferase family 39 protein, partial [Streptosporangiales bacterium]|nr:glycosyltransferase family 39 protein [Streptosporangiales bacterium]
PHIVATCRETNGAQLPYYIALHYWMAVFGSSVLSLRLLSVLTMAAAAVFVTLAARELAGARAALASGLVFAVVPSVSRFAQEVRFYAPALMATALATWLLARALDRPSSWSRWAGYAAAMAALGYLNLAAMAILAGHAVWAVLRWREDRDRRLAARFALAVLASVAVCTPMIMLGSGQAAFQLSWVPKPSLDPVVLWKFAANLFYSGTVAAAVLVLAALAWAFRPRILAGYVTAVALVPLAAVAVLSEGSVSYFYPRYVLFALVPLAIGAGVTITGISRLGVMSRRPAAGGVLAAVVVAAVALAGAHDQAMIREPVAHNWPGYPNQVVYGAFAYPRLARIVGENARPGDGIAYPSSIKYRFAQPNVGIDYYIGSYLRPGVHEPRLVFASRSAVRANRLYYDPCGEVRCLGNPARVWLAASRTPWPDPLSIYPAAEEKILRQRYTIAREWQVGDMVVLLLDRR